MDKLGTKIEQLLRKTEPIFKTDMVYLAHGGFWLTLGQLTSSLIIFILAVAYANFLPKEIYGTYKYVLSFAGILTAFTLAGMNTAVVRAVAQGFEGTLRSAFWMKLRWSILMATLAFVSAGYYLLKGNETLGFSLIIVGVALPVIQSVSLYGSYLNGKKEFRAQSFYGIVSSVVVAVLMLLAIFLTGDVLPLVLAYFVGTAAITFFLYTRTLKKFPPNEKADPSAIEYGKHLSVMTFFGTIAGSLDSFLLWHFLGPIALAVYSFAIAIPNLIKDILGNLTTLALPKLSQRSMKEIRERLPHRMTIIFIIAGLATIGYIIIAPFIYDFFFSQYTEAIWYSQILMLTALFLPTSIIHSALTAHAHKKKLYILSLGSPLSRIGLLVILLPQYGILGAVMSLIGSQLFISILLLYFSKKMM